MFNSFTAAIWQPYADLHVNLQELHLEKTSENLRRETWSYPSIPSDIPVRDYTSKQKA